MTQYNRFYGDFDFEHEDFETQSFSAQNFDYSRRCVMCVGCMSPIGMFKARICSRCKQKNSCKECLKQVRLKTLGEKDTRLMCIVCLDEYKTICNSVKNKRDFYGFL